MFNPNTIIPDSIVAILILSTIFMAYKAIKPFFKKKRTVYKQCQIIQKSERFDREKTEMKANLNLTISENGKAKFTYNGDIALIARAIIRLAKHDDEFAVALNTGMVTLLDDLEAIRLRDEMIGMIQNPEQ